MHGKTTTIALVGADGCGKTSVADAILAASSPPCKYLYMGPAIGSSSHALPTTRLIGYLRRRAVQPMLKADRGMPPEELQSAEMKRKLRRGRLAKTLGLINRVAEEWYRQGIAWLYQLQGFSVVCDRHYLFEYCPDSPSQRRPDERLSVRIHHWLLAHAYPQPGLVVFLDAPAAVLHARKPEWTTDYLDKQRQRIREQGQAVRNFCVVDVTQPLDSVIAEVTAKIQEHAGIEPAVSRVG